MAPTRTAQFDLSEILGGRGARSFDIHKYRAVHGNILNRSMNAFLARFVQCPWRAVDVASERHQTLKALCVRPESPAKIGARALRRELIQPGVFACDVTVRNVGKTFRSAQPTFYKTT